MQECRDTRVVSSVANARVVVQLEYQREPERRDRSVFWPASFISRFVARESVTRGDRIRSQPRVQWTVLDVRVQFPQLSRRAINRRVLLDELEELQEILLELLLVRRAGVLRYYAAAIAPRHLRTFCDGQSRSETFVRIRRNASSTTRAGNELGNSTGFRVKKRCFSIT